MIRSVVVSQWWCVALASSIPTITLNDGRHIPSLGLGTFKIKHLTEEIVGLAIDTGYRLVDTAPVYNYEIAVGRAVRQKIREGVVKREDLFIVNKLWNTHHSKGEVLKACEKSMRFLSIDYIDLYLMNWPFGVKSRPTTRDNFKKQEFYEFDNTSLEDTWREMEETVRKGWVKSIGVSNFNSSQLQRILKIATFKPVVNEIECSVRLPQHELIQLCRDRGVAVIGYRPLGAPGRVIELTKAEQWQIVLSKNYNMKQIAKKHNKTTAQVILRYIVELSAIPIPKTADGPERLKENMDVFDFKLDEDDTKYIRTLENNFRTTLYETAKNHKEYPFHTPS